MGISRYLAMTAAELETFSLPEGWSPAYMACHFSPYTTGLSNMPGQLPQNSMLIVNDRTPLHGHDPRRIASQLAEAFDILHFDSLLLDLERPGVTQYEELCRSVAKQLPCPVGVSPQYAGESDCAVFLPPVPLDQPPEEYIAPWKGRELWLDIAPEAVCVTVTETGSEAVPLPFSEPPENAHTDEALYCRYRAEVSEDAVLFHLWRDLPQIEQLIEHAQALGITKCVGLYQQLCADK